uniref:SAM domain-containing protein n=1 Tax=Paramoeba aestuarina TaxID=180227 RepID=A0A7S4N7G1_9EUKA
MNADYMDFMNVASAVREKTVNALNSVEDLEGFAKHIGVMDWQGAGRGREEGRVSSLLDMEMVEQHCPSKQEKSRGFRKSQQPKRGPRTQMNMGHRATSPSPVLARMGGLGNSQQRSTGDLLGGGGGLAGSMGGGGETKSFDASLLSDNVNLDIFVQIANSSTHVTVPRSVLVKEAIELTMKGLKKKVTKKAKKIEPQHFFNKSTGIWLDDHRAVWTYLLKENEKMELKSKPNQMNNRKIEVQIKLESGTKTATLDYVPETTVRGVIQLIEKPNKSIVKDIHLYGLILGSEGSGSQIWLDESRTLTSYGVSNSNNKLVFALRSSVIGGNVTKKRAILLRVQTEMGTKTMQFDENNKAHDVISRICIRMSLDPDQHCLYLTEQNKYMADELPISCYAVTPTQSLVLRKKGYGWLPDKPNVEMLGQNLDKITFRCLSVPSSAPPSFSKWGVEEVCEWLREIGMEDNVVECFEKGNMDGGKLGDATSGSLKDLGIAPLGTRKEIVRQMLKMK